MSIQQSLNQALGSATFLAQTNPYLIDKFQTNKQISALQKKREAIGRTQSKITESKAEMMREPDTEYAVAALDALQAKHADLDNQQFEIAEQLYNLKPTSETEDLYAEELGWQTSPLSSEKWSDKRRQMAESKAYESQLSTINSIQDQKQGFEERRNLLKNKGSLRQQLKEQGYNAKEIRQAYSNKKKGSEE